MYELQVLTTCENGSYTPVLHCVATFFDYLSKLFGAGFQYVNLDDCWMKDRTDDGEIVADPVRFPSGMKALGEYIHSKGLKFGLYSDAGTKTCEGLPGSWGHEAADAQIYAYWGVDYLKYDFCNMNVRSFAVATLVELLSFTISCDWQVPYKRTDSSCRRKHCRHVRDVCVMSLVRAADGYQERLKWLAD